jgi:hypothetical protein
MFRSSLDDMKVIQYRILKSYSSNAYILIDDVNTELPNQCQGILKIRQ